MVYRKRFLLSCGSIGLTATFLFPPPVSALVHTPTPGKIVTLKRWIPNARVNPKAYARFLLLGRGWGAREYGCLVNLWTRESNWNPRSKNSNSTAFGIAQMLVETSKDPAIQISRGLRYISARYGSPCGAYSFWQRNYYY